MQIKPFDLLERVAKYQTRFWTQSSYSLSVKGIFSTFFKYLYPSCFRIFFKHSRSSCKVYSSPVVDNSLSSSSGKLFKLSGTKFVLRYFISCLKSSLSYTLPVDRKWLPRGAGSLWENLVLGDISGVRAWSFVLRSLFALRGWFLWPLFYLDNPKALYLSILCFLTKCFSKLVWFYNKYQY